MTLQDYCDAINVQIKLTYYPNQDSRWSASFEDAEVKQGHGLLSAYGSGKSPALAINDYVTQIRGKRIVLSAMSIERRREFDVPANLSAHLQTPI